MAYKTYYKTKTKRYSRTTKTIKTHGLASHVTPGDTYRLERIPQCFGRVNSNHKCSSCPIYLACLECSQI